ncbi:CubicO group peptidase (beta-lactamase class C family) [Kribbella orskensis]|uniref:CubicO group peptidase (Beta-lactamase class C family) n=1 Tax=Kribbella orskensis TaxID=2512216 RepID=A0ABY2BIP9_9ACTN|nr:MULTISPECIES: serine hydrolase domain-containing protein [Kribbella]TCN39132.1 CubicO group peptidase (beta-lactamase class C family) [Kribbella sp. VKM Ac-2500]TCO21779.1 CubicO group peptidase (beta-lactamase class C family) [Kribbella orskensis]
MSTVTVKPEEVGMSSAGLENVTRLVRRYVDQGRYAGTVSVVARRGEVVHFEANGSMDVERGHAMRPDTIFRIYSMTKPIVSVGLMLLYEQGLFQLNDPVSAYLPELANLKVFAGGDAESFEVREPARPMTVRDLLMHTSGLAALNGKNPVGELYRRAGLTGMDSTASLADLPRQLAELPLQADPGSRWIYGISTDLVGLLCEVISGQPLDQYLQDRLFDPLGMIDTGFSVPEPNIHRLAAAYTYAEPGRQQSRAFVLADDPWTSAYTRPRSFLSGVAGLVSTAGDYLRFCRMMAGGGSVDGVRVMGPRTLRFMTANHLPDGRDLASMADFGGETRREGQGFGLGFGVLLDQTVAQTIGTKGEYFWGGAASTAFWVSPADDLIAIFLTQLRPSATYPIRRELRAAVYSSLTD